MKDVECWCCENYKLFIDESTDNGFCILHGTRLSAYDVVCKFFIKRCGLYTKRSIPEYCINYFTHKDP